ncbi:Cyclin, N-terminal domain [Musa troglodytarum]|uniref:Cyclin, N-terminal domain n=1 Tax=Musa troglodytarum TaxID=320322 RepID=A0A9E7HWR0_9LILI|nr:Cyclin, N-terminal domain [Musa troglodytarum]
MAYSLENPLDYSGDDGKPLVALFAAEADHDAAISDEPTVSVRRDAVARIRKAAEPPCSVGPSTAYLAVTYLDRFLTKRVTQVDEEQYAPRLASFMLPRTDPSFALFLFQVKKPWFAVFLSLTCLSLASKMLDHGFSVDEFQATQPFQFMPETIERMQLLVLETLGWRMRSITPFAFLDYFLSSFPSTDPRQVQDLKDRASKTLFQAQTEEILLGFKPSVIAASALHSAAFDLFPAQFPDFESVVSSSLGLDPERIRVCQELLRKVNTNRCDSAAAAAAAKNVASGSGTPLAAMEHGGEGDTIRGSGSDGRDDKKATIQIVPTI